MVTFLEIFVSIDFIDLVTVSSEDPEQAKLDKERIDKLVNVFLEKNKENKHGIVWDPPRNMFGSGILKRYFNNFISRFGSLAKRSWKQNARDVRVNGLRLVASIGQALLFDVIFPRVRNGSIAASIADRTALLSFGVISMSMMALSKTLMVFGKEKAVVMRERNRGQYGALEYLLSKIFAEIPFDSLYGAVFASCLKYRTKLRCSYSQICKIFSIMTITGASLGFAIGSVTQDVEEAMSVGLPLMVVLMSVGVINPGGVDTTVTPPLVIRSLASFSPVKWAIEAVLVAEFQDMKFSSSQDEKHGFLNRFRDLPKMGGLALVQDGNQVLDALGLKYKSFDGIIQNMMKLTLVNLVISWIGLTFAGPRYLNTHK